MDGASVLGVGNEPLGVLSTLGEGSVPSVGGVSPSAFGSTEGVAPVESVVEATDAALDAVGFAPAGSVVEAAVGVTPAGSAFGSTVGVAPAGSVVEATDAVLGAVGVVVVTSALRKLAV